MKECEAGYVTSNVVVTIEWKEMKQQFPSMSSAGEIQGFYFPRSLFRHVASPYWRSWMVTWCVAGPQPRYIRPDW